MWKIVLLLLVSFISGCASSDEVTSYRGAQIVGMPQSIEDIRAIKSEERLREILTPVRGRYTVIRYISKSNGMPLINDSGSVRTVIVVLDRPSLAQGRYELGDGIKSAYFTYGAPSRPVGAFCLGFATKGSIAVEKNQSGSHNVSFDLDFSALSAGGFQNVCDNVHLERSEKDVAER